MDGKIIKFPNSRCETCAQPRAIRFHLKTKTIIKKHRKRIIIIKGKRCERRDTHAKVFVNARTHLPWQVASSDAKTTPKAPFACVRACVSLPKIFIFRRSFSDCVVIQSCGGACVRASMRTLRQKGERQVRSDSSRCWRWRYENQ